jgi:prefoldin subunit 5
MSIDQRIEILESAVKSIAETLAKLAEQTEAQSGAINGVVTPLAVGLHGMAESLKSLTAQVQVLREELMTLKKASPNP